MTPISTAKQPFYKLMYVQVLFAIICGIALGNFYPDLAVTMKPLGDGFIKLVKMIIVPIVFLTVVHGIGSMNDMTKLGRIGGKAFIYFEIVSTLALIIGLVAANYLQPGSGVNADPAALDSQAISGYVQQAEHSGSWIDHILHIIPNTFMASFASGDILQTLFVAILCGVGLVKAGEKGQSVLSGIEKIMHIVFIIINMLMKLAPIGAFGAMAFTIGQYGIGTLGSLAKLMVVFYMTAGLFIFVVLGAIARLTGFSLWRFICYIKDELILVIGTSSSESALPSLIKKLEKLGCSESVVGLVVPMGYSFNLDGTNIYMTMAALFVAQAMNIDLSLMEQLTILAVALLTSKGATGVTGSGFIILASTLAVVPSVPVAGMALILGIDRFMSECRAVTNFIGNAVATVVISRWEKDMDDAKLESELRCRMD